MVQRCTHQNARKPVHDVCFQFGNDIFDPGCTLVSIASTATEFANCFISTGYDILVQESIRGPASTPIRMLQNIDYTIMIPCLPDVVSL